MIQGALEVLIGILSWRILSHLWSWARKHKLKLFWLGFTYVVYDFSEGNRGAELIKVKLL